MRDRRVAAVVTVDVVRGVIGAGVTGGAAVVDVVTVRGRGVAAVRAVDVLLLLVVHMGSLLAHFNE
jgi:hypothetical protein